MVFVPMAEAPTKPGAKDLSYDSLNLIHKFTIVYIRVLNQPKASPRVIFSWKNFIQQLKVILVRILIERWRRPSMLSSMCQHVTRLQFDRCAKKDSLCGTVMMAWIWHVWINAIVFVRTAKAPPKAGATELSYSSLNLSLKERLLVSDQTDLFSFATHGDEYGMPRKALTETGKGRHWTLLFFCGCASKGQDSPKVSPRLLSSERTW